MTRNTSARSNGSRKRLIFSVPMCIATFGGFGSAARAQTAPLPVPSPAVAPEAPLPGSAARTVAEIDPVKYIPADVITYADISIPAGQAYLRSMRDTRLGQAFQAWSKAREAGAQTASSAGSGQLRMAARTVPARNRPAQNRQLEMLQALLKGFGQHIGVAERLPASMAQPTMPEFFAVAPVIDLATVRAELNLASAYLKSQPGFSWTETHEGDIAIEVGSPTHQTSSGSKMQVAYALAPDAFLISNSEPAIRSMIRIGQGNAPSLGSSAEFKAALPHVDTSQFLWGYTSTQAALRAWNSVVKSMPTGKAGDQTQAAVQKAFDSWLQNPQVADAFGSFRGSVFSLSLQPDRIDLQALSMVDPGSKFGQLVQNIHGSAADSAKLTSGRTLFYADMLDAPEWVTVYSTLLGPLVQSLTSAIPQEQGGAMAATLLGSVGNTLQNLARGSGNEIAISLGPSGPGSTIPVAGQILITKSDRPELEQGVQGVMSLFTTFSGEKWYPKEILGVPTRIFGSASSPIRPVFARVGDYDVFALDQGSIKTPIYLSQNQGRALASEPGFQKIAGLLGNQLTALGYLDLQSVIRLGLIDQARQAAGRFRPRPASAGSPGRHESPEAHAFEEQLVGGLQQLAGGYTQDPAGFASRIVLTYDPNAQPVHVSD